MQKQNLTLTVEADILKGARKYALDHDTSVNQLVRDYLAGIASQKDELERARLELKELFKKSTYKMGKRTWTRDDLHERR